MKIKPIRPYQFNSNEIRRLQWEAEHRRNKYEEAVTEVNKRYAAAVAAVAAMDNELCDLSAELNSDLKQIGEDLKWRNEEEKQMKNNHFNSVKSPEVHNGWQTWRNALDRVVNSRFYVGGAKSFALARRLCDFATREMAHYNGRYHNGQICKLP